MMRRLGCSLLAASAVASVVAGCGSGRTDGGAPSPSPSASSVRPDDLLVSRTVDEDDLAGLGFAFAPVPAGQGVLRGPAFAFEVTGITVVDELTAAQRERMVSQKASPSPPRSDPDNEFLVLSIKTFGLSAKGVQAVFRFGAHTVTRGAGGTIMMIEVPAGAPAGVDITSADRTQRMDLRTGRTADLIEGYYPVRTGGVLIDCGVTVTQPGIDLKFPNNVASVQVTLDLSLVPHVPDKGWAPTGRRWLVAKIFTRLASLDGNLLATVDLAKDLALTGPEGRLPIGEVVNAAGGGQNRTEVILDVPAPVTSLSASFGFSGTLTYRGQPAGWRAGGTSAGSGVKSCRQPTTINM